MPQSFLDIPADQPLRDSRAIILDRDEALRSVFSGSAFPTSPAPVEGQLCWRSDEGQLYQRRGAAWVRVIADGLGGASAAQAASVAAVVTALADKQDTSARNQANGYAGLDGSGKVAAAQLPSYVDDVLEVANVAALPGTGETGKIYVALDQNRTYRWSGSQYVEVSAGSATVLLDIAALRAATWASEQRPQVLTLRRNWVDNDGGGSFDLITGTAADDGALIIVDAAGNRWRRLAAATYDARWWGVVGDGTTVNTAALQAAITASAGRVLRLPAGTILTGPVTGVSNIIIEGQGIGRTVIRRPAAAATGSLITWTTCTNFEVRDLTVDGNKANQSNGGNNIALLTGCSDFVFERIASINAKGVAGGWGSGLTVNDADNVTATRASAFRHCQLHDNDGSGTLVDECYNLTIERCEAHRNGGAGIDIINLDLPFEIERNSQLRVIDNECHANTVAGIRLYGNVTGTGPVATPDYSPFSPSGVGTLVSGNKCRGNGQYGLAYQQAFGAVLNNWCRDNGNGSLTFGDYLFNAWASIFANNISMYANGYYGIDAGGCHNCVIADNLIAYAGVTPGLQAVGLNIGGSNENVVTGNVFLTNGVTAGGYQINIMGIESDGTATGTFNWNTNRLALRNNVMTVTGSQIGIYASRGVRSLTCIGNEVIGAAAGKAFVLEVANLLQRDNVDWSNGGLTPTLPSASTLIIPDAGDVFFVSGTTNITAFQTLSQSTWAGKVRFLNVTPPTPGTTKTYSVPPTVSFSGGGGTGATATALLNNDGQVVQVAVDNPGSGYTSAPTVAFGGGTVTGGTVDPAATAFVGCNNADGRIVRLMFQGALTVTDGGGANNDLAGNLSTASNKTTLVLRGAYGQWYEESRSQL